MTARGMIHPKLHVDLGWLNRISYNLERFHKVKNDVFCARCPVCGDSVKNKKATRFYIYTKKGKLNVYCHNCGYSKSFYNFMKEHNPIDFDAYKQETLFDAFKTAPNAAMQALNTLLTVKEENATQHVPGVLYSEFIKHCVPVVSLDKKHPALMYLKGRGFTVLEYGKLLYTDDFGSIARLINPESGKDLKKEPRIVIPFVTPEGVVEMVQGRSLDSSNKMRYISIKASDDIVKIFGRYGLDETEVVRCVEGPLDSLFVDNCIATCDGNLNRSDADVLIWDIQPRNSEILRYMEEAIETRRSLVIWPMVPDKKLDINDLINKGVTRKQLMAMINSHTYSGLTAKLKFTQWKRM